MNDECGICGMKNPPANEPEKAIHELLHEYDHGGWYYFDMAGAINVLAERDRAVAEKAWDDGYVRGVRDNESELEPADNPHRGTPIGVRVSAPVGKDET